MPQPLSVRLCSEGKMREISYVSYMHALRNYLKCGVPQGTILGPLLFLIYINDLPSCLSFIVPRMYADDTRITYAGSDLHLIQSSLSNDLEKLSK